MDKGDEAAKSFIRFMRSMAPTKAMIDAGKVDTRPGGHVRIAPDAHDEERAHKLNVAIYYALKDNARLRDQDKAIDKLILDYSKETEQRLFARLTAVWQGPPEQLQYYIAKIKGAEG